VLLILDGGVCRLFTEYSSGPRAVLEWLQEELGRPLATTADPAARLTPRQRQVLECLLDGDSEKQAAARLGLHPGTLHVHVKRVYKALGVSSRAELLAHFLRRYRAASRPTPGADGNPRA
jgi:DNA-binding NarL/FixJ family response regulator